MQLDFMQNMLDQQISFVYCGIIELVDSTSRIESGTQ